MKKYLTFFLVIFLGSSAFAYQSPFDVVWEDLPLKVSAGGTITTDVVIRIPQGHFIYKDKTTLDFTALQGVRVKDIKYPKATRHADPVTGKTVEIFPEGEAIISVVLYVPSSLSAGEHEVTAVLEFQGCEEKLCLRPEDRAISWGINIMPAAVAGDDRLPELMSEKGPSFAELLNIKDFKNVIMHGWFIAFLISFVAGLLTSLTPCVWPLIPVTLLIIGVHKKANVIKNLGLSMSLVAGISVTYSILGLIAVLAGGQVGFLFQKRIFVAVAGMFFLAMSASMFGLFTMQLPSGARNFFSKLGGSGYRGAFLTGISIGFLATPCVGPVLGPMLLWVAAQKVYLLGVGLLFTYAMGIGMFYILVGTFYGTVAGRLKGVNTGVFVKKVFGVALLIPALYYFGTLIHDNELIESGIKWRYDEAVALSEAVSHNKPVMMVFGARWCASCTELETATLRDDEVVKNTDKFIPLYIDATVETEGVKHLLDKYHIIGMPTILFILPSGDIYDSLIGEAPTPKELLNLMTNTLKHLDT